MTERPAESTEADPRSFTLGVVLWRSLMVLAVIATAIGITFWLFDGQQMLQTALALSPGTIMVCLALALANYLLRSLRWLSFGYAAGIHVPVANQLLYYFAGFSLTVTPGKAGELVRLWLLRRHHGVTYAESLPLLAGDRLFDIVGISLLTVIGAAGSSQRLALALTAALVSVGLLAALLRPRLPLKVLALLRVRIGRCHGLFDSLSRVMLTFAKFGRPRILLPSLVSSVVGWFAECMVLILVLQDLDVHIGLFEGVLIFCFSTIAGAVSMLPGGLGAADLSLFGLLRLMGAPSNVAVLATTVVRLLTLWFAVALGTLILPLVLRRTSTRATVANA